MKWKVLIFCLLIQISIAIPLFSLWEVAVIFLGAKESNDYQKDIDRNILELAQIESEGNLTLSIYREFKDRTVFYFPDSSSQKLHSWDSLFYEIFPVGIKIPGELNISPRKPDDPFLLLNSKELSIFLKKAFSHNHVKAKASRLLIIETHGLGTKGLKGIKLKELRKQLETTLPKRENKPLDILWLDACFMAAIEVAYELRNISSLFMASEEAEFSAGLPFDILEELDTQMKDPLFLAKLMGERFLESYSFIQEGIQRKAVYSSPATLSIVNLNTIDSLVSHLAQMVKIISPLSKEQKKKLKNASIRIPETDLVDLGSALMSLKKNKEDPLKINSILKMLNVDSQTQLKTNIRILAKPKNPDSLLVYGYENWQRGHNNDREILNKIPENLKPTLFVEGPYQKYWPARPVRKRLYLTPFSVGLSHFSFFFADPKTHTPLEPLQTFSKTQDIAVFDSLNPNNPLLFSGYTQGVGSAAERYTGLSILDIFGNSADLDYLDTDFNQKTHWASF